MEKKYVCPKPIVDKKESDSLDDLTQKYKKCWNQARQLKQLIGLFLQR